jgi:hypothetical protein
MSNPSPRAHLVRLVGVLILGFGVFLVVRGFAVPSSWNAKEWYRQQALVDLQQQPMKFGGSESCLACHKDKHDELMAGAHKSQACESCHGPIVHHVKGNQKIANAIVDNSRENCLNCHQKLESRPVEFKQIDIEAIKVAVEANKSFDGPSKHKKLVDDTVQCVRCHDFHDPGA